MCKIAYTKPKVSHLKSISHGIYHNNKSTLIMILVAQTFHVGSMLSVFVTDGLHIDPYLPMGYT